MDHLRMTISINMALILNWPDPRIETNFREGHKDHGWVQIGVKEYANIWTPDLYVYGLDIFQQKKLIYDMSSLKIMYGTFQIY